MFFYRVLNDIIIIVVLVFLKILFYIFYFLLNSVSEIIKSK